MLLLGSCGSDDSEVEKILTSIEIETSNGTRIDLANQETTTLTAIGLDQQNEPIEITSTVTWSSDNANISVDQNGLVTPLIVGSSTITAEAENISKSIVITVWDSTQPRTEIWVSDAGDPVGSAPFQILKYDENGENPEAIITEGLGWPQDILFLEDEGQVLISNLNSKSIRRHDINTGEFISDFASSIGDPTRIKIGPDNLLYVLQWAGNGTVLRYQLDGTFVDEFTFMGVAQSIGLDWDADGNLYVSSFNNGTGGSVRKFDTDGNDQGLFISSNIDGPTDIWFMSSGELWVNDWQHGTIKRFDSEGDFLGTVASGLSQNEGVDFLENGNMLIGNGGPGSVKMYGPDGTFIEDLITTGLGGLLSPNAVRVRHVNPE